jgi:hypothetical protein
MRSDRKAMSILVCAASIFLVRCSPVSTAGAGVEDHPTVSTGLPREELETPASASSPTHTRIPSTRTSKATEEPPAFVPVLVEDAALNLPAETGSIASLPNRAAVWTLNSGEERSAAIPAFAPDGSVWIRVDKGLYRYGQGQWAYYGLPEGGRLAEALAVAPDGRIWTGLSGSDPVVFDGQQWRAYPTQGLGFLKALIADPGGEIWMAGTYGIARWGNDRFDLFSFSFPDTGQPISFCAAAAAPDGKKWFASCFFVGMKFYSFDGREWKEYLKDLPGFITSMAVDQDGIIWAGAVGEGAGGFGLYRMEEESALLYYQADGLDDCYVLSVAVAPDNAVWLTNPKGAYRFDGERFVQIRPVRGNYSIAVSPGGDVWLGGYGEVVRLYRDAGG